jgi:hypothetical protein
METVSTKLISVKAVAPTCIKYEDVIDDPLLAIAFSAAENYQILAELGGGVAVPRRWRLARRLARVDLKNEE